MGIQELEQQRTEEMVHCLGRVELTAGQACDEVLHGLREQFQASSALMYRPAPEQEGWSLALGHISCRDPASVFLPELANYLATAPPRFNLFNPLRPEAPQRNQVMTWSLQDPEIQDLHMATLFNKLGVGREAQMRVLVCDGPLLLAWVGAFREKPFESRERERLAALVPALQRRLQLERVLGEDALSPGMFSAAFDAVPSPAFLVRGNGAIAHANAAGVVLLERSKARVMAELRDSVCAPERAAARGIQWSQVSESGRAPVYLAIWQVAAHPQDSPRLSSVAHRYKLTAREAEVLWLITRGDANKDISAKLKCTVRTIEAHATSLFRKFKVLGRTELVARFWLEP